MARTPDPRKLAAGRVKRVHVNQHHIRDRIRDPETTEESHPVVTVKAGGDNFRADVARIMVGGREVARVVFHHDRKLGCGARCWVETHAEVRMGEG